METKELKKFCQYCKAYSRKTKKCSITENYTARKQTCEKFEGIKR